MSALPVSACDLCGAHVLQAKTKQYSGCWSENCICMDEGPSACKAGPQMTPATLCLKCCVCAESCDDDILFGWRLFACWSETYLDKRISGPSFEKCLNQITPAQEGTRVLVGTGKVPGTIATDHRDALICDVKVGDKTLTLHGHDYDVAWPAQLTVGFVNADMYENRCCACQCPMGSCGSQYCGKTVCLRESSDSDASDLDDGFDCAKSVPMVVEEFCTGIVKTQFVKRVGHVQYMHVQQTSLPQLENRKVTFAQIYDYPYVKAIVHPSQETLWHTLWSTRHMCRLTPNIWHTIFWMVATTFHPTDVGQPVLLDGAFGDKYEDGFAPHVSDDEEDETAKEVAHDAFSVVGGYNNKKQKITHNAN